MGSVPHQIPASDKVEIIPRVATSNPPVRRTLDKIGSIMPTFDSWYDHKPSGRLMVLENLLPVQSLKDLSWQLTFKCHIQVSTPQLGNSPIQ